MSTSELDISLACHPVLLFLIETHLVLQGLVRHFLISSLLGCLVCPKGYSTGADFHDNLGPKAGQDGLLQYAMATVT